MHKKLSSKKSKTSIVLEVIIVLIIALLSSYGVVLLQTYDSNLSVEVNDLILVMMSSFFTIVFLYIIIKTMMKAGIRKFSLFLILILTIATSFFISIGLNGKKELKSFFLESLVTLEVSVNDSIYIKNDVKSQILSNIKLKEYEINSLSADNIFNNSKKHYNDLRSLYESLNSKTKYKKMHIYMNNLSESLFNYLFFGIILIVQLCVLIPFLPKKESRLSNSW